MFKLWERVRSAEDIVFGDQVYARKGDVLIIRKVFPQWKHYYVYPEGSSESPIKVNPEALEKLCQSTSSEL